MYNDFEVFRFVAAFGFLFSLLSLMVGFIWGEKSSNKKREAEEQKEKQQKMWKEYLEALKGGQHERK
jgi:hypothetical protein